MLYQTTDELLDQLRSQLDEDNTSNITDSELLQALNRSQRTAFNIVARKCEDLMWSHVDITMIEGTASYSLTDLTFGRRIELVEVIQDDRHYKVQNISNHMKSRYKSDSNASIPVYYTQERNQITVYPIPSVGNTLRINYFRAPEKLLLNQGQITTVDTSNNYLIVDSAGSSLATTTSGFQSYINIIDYRTGVIKGSYQISAINTTTGQIDIKTTGLTRTTVLGKTISTSLSSTIEADDLVCLITGTCVSELPLSYVDYLIQHSVVAIRRRLGEDTTHEFAELKSIEKELEGIWKGRAHSNRIRKANPHWSSLPFIRLLR